MKKKTIFTIMTLGLVTLLGFGFLGGIHYQTKEAKASEITTQPNKKYSKVTPSINNPLDKTKYYYVEAKNYAQNGQGAFYENSISIENSLYIGNTNADQYPLMADFDLITGSTTTYVRFQFNTNTSTGQTRLYSVLFSTQDFSRSTTIYNAGNGTFNRNACAFVITNLRGFGWDSQSKEEAFYWLLNKLFNIYALEDIFYEFSDINPYTYWNVATNSPYVNFVTFDGAIEGLAHKDIRLSPFFVGGLAFNYIRLYYIGLNAGDHFNINGEQYIYQGNSNRYMTFSHAVFYNSATQYEVKFYQQEASYGAFGYEGLTYLCSFNYTNLNFKTLQFFEDLTPTMINDLDALSNINQNIGYHATNDVGLGNAFALISQAFTAWVPILSISVIPGITLGMLLFLPLIAGIVIFIIWIVKR